MKLRVLKHFLFVALITLVPMVVFGQDSGGGGKTGLGAIAKNLTDVLSSFATLILSISTIAGLGFGVASAFKFKQHKDNPTQVPLGQPLTLLGIGVMLLWLPFILKSAGETITGGNKDESTKIGELPSFIGGDTKN